MKNKLAAGLAIILVFAVLTGCSGGGISQAKYDTAVADRDNAKSQLTQVQADLKTAQDQIVQLQNKHDTSGFSQTGPTDLTQVSWHPVAYVDKTYGFKLSYPDTWKITTRGTASVPFEVQYNIDDMVPGSWVGVMTDSSDNQYTQSKLVDIMSGWADYQYITSGDTVLADNKTPGSYVEFISTVTNYLMHIYMVGYVDGDHWLYYSVWTIESVTPWDGDLMREIAHTFTKASSDEIAHATTPPTTPKTTTPTTTKPTTPSLSSYTDSTYNFTFKYDATWTGTWKGTNNPVSYANPTYSDPSVRIYVVPKTWGATLADVLISSDMLKQYNPTTPPTNPAIDSTGADVTNGNGVKATPILFHFTWTDGTTAQSKAYGFSKGDNWFIMFLTISSGWNLGIDSVSPDDVFNSWKFN